MWNLSRRAGRLEESVTLAITAKAKAIAASGERVVKFGAGEPDFDTPDHIKKAAKQALDGRVGSYTPVPGTPDLREAVAAMYRDTGVAAETERVIVSCGAKHSLFNALAVLLDDGDEAILPAPYWVSYPSMIQAAGAKAVIVDTREDGCILTPEKLEAAITDRTKVVVSVSPGNPTGVTHSREQLAAIGEVLKRHESIAVVSDEIYEHLVYGDTEFTPFAVACPDLADRVITVRGMSKSWAMTGWRIGFATGPGEVVRAMIRFQSHTTSNPAAIAQAASLAALQGPRDAVWEMRKAFDRRRKLMTRLLGDIDGFELVPPNGAFYCFPDVGARLDGRTTVEFAEELLDKERVATVPGAAFGADRNIRLSYACSDEDIEEGCARLKRFVEG